MYGQSPGRVSGKNAEQSLSMGGGGGQVSAGREGSGSLPKSSSSSSGRTSRGRTASDGSPYCSGRTVSPLNLPMDSFQALSASYTAAMPIPGTREGTTFASMSLPRKSPLQSPPSQHERSSSLTNVARERSLDRLEREREHILMGERSLDRHLDHRMILSTSSLGKDRGGYLARDRSLDREYPHMGARSLERDHHSYHSRSRSMERSGDYGASMMLSPSPTSQEYRNSFIFELQVQISELHKECAKLQKESDNAREKLSSCMNSIKTFWSPELKKERSLRKEEAAKCSMYLEQLKIAQAELKKTNELLAGSGKAATWNGVGISHQESEATRQEREKQAKEILILRKTVDEMELRLETQKQTLQARDESIRKLLEMLGGRGKEGSLPRPSDQEKRTIDALRAQSAEDQHRIASLENMLHQRDLQVASLKNEMRQLQEEQRGSYMFHSQSDGNHTLQALLEAKDARIAGLETEVCRLEERLLRLREEGLAGERLEPQSPSHRDKMMRQEVERLRSELTAVSTDREGLRMKLDTLERQKVEQQHYVNVLKEQLNAREQQVSMLNADIEDLQERVKDKEGTIDRKSRQSQNAAKEKRRMESEIVELKDHLEIKDRKIGVLQRKVESLEEALAEREEQLSQTRLKLSTSVADSMDSAVSSLEESLTDREKQIERLKERQEQLVKEQQEEVQASNARADENKKKLEALTQEHTQLQHELCELKEKAAELKSDKFGLESKVRQMEAELEDKATQVKKLQEIQAQAPPANQMAMVSAVAGEKVEAAEKQVAELSAELVAAREELAKVKAELEKSAAAAKEVEAGVAEKDALLKDLQEQVKEYKQKMGTLKRNQNTEKLKNAQMLEEARKREDNLSDDAAQMKTALKQRDDRIEELEEALRESVRITAQREMDMAEQQIQIDDLKKQVDNLKTEIDALQQTAAESGARVSNLTKSLEEKENKLKRLQAERNKHLEEVFEMKQEAIQAAISEKDANLALLEMTSTKAKKNTEEIERLTAEKAKLNQQLKELTQNRMRQLQKEGSKEVKSKTKKSAAQKLSGASSEQVDPYVLTAVDPSLLDP